MSVPTTPACPLGLTHDDLSAWRDHTLAPDDERRITAHATSCPACQRTIAAHDALATALQNEPAPAPDPRNWPRLQARINGERQPRATAAPTFRRAQRPAIWGGLSAAAAVLVLSALFFHLFQQQAGLRGASSQHKTVAAATPAPLTAVAPTQPIAGPKLNWQSFMAPESVIPTPENQSLLSNFAFDPTDAGTTYICSYQASSSDTTPISIWATHDSAATWKHVSDVPFTGYLDDCSLTVDAHNPQRLSIAIWGQGGQTLKGVGASYISDDGAQTWRALSDGVMMSDLATWDQTGVALTVPIANIFDLLHTQPARLNITHDGWHTWSPIDSPLLEQGYVVSHVWQRPDDGALLVEVAQRQIEPINGSSTPSLVPLTQPVPTSLWQTVDLGAHWSPLPAPPNLIALHGFVVAQPLGNAPWRACGFTQSDSGSTQSQLIGCTEDGGQTWTSRPLPALKEPCGAGCLQQQQILGGSALLSDGSLITTFYAGPQSADVVETPSMFHIFRLAPRATQWQDFGPAPNNGQIALDGTPTGTLVSVTGGSTLDGVSGSIVGHLGGDVPNRGALAFATLP